MSALDDLVAELTLLAETLLGIGEDEPNDFYPLDEWRAKLASSGGEAA